MRYAYEIWCFSLHDCLMRFADESSCFLLHNLLMRCHAFEPLRDCLMRVHAFCPPMRYRHEICRVLLLHFHLRFPSEIVCFSGRCRFVLAMLCFVGGITLLCEFMLFGCYDISLRDNMVCEHGDISWDYLMSFHAFRDPTRFPCKICCCLLHNFTYAIFWYEIACFLSVVRCPYEITCLWPQIFQ